MPARGRRRGPRPAFSRSPSRASMVIETTKRQPAARTPAGRRGSVSSPRRPTVAFVRHLAFRAKRARRPGDGSPRPASAGVSVKQPARERPACESRALVTETAILAGGKTGARGRAHEAAGSSRARCSAGRPRSPLPAPTARVAGSQAPIAALCTAPDRPPAGGGFPLGKRGSAPLAASLRRKRSAARACLGTPGAGMRRDARPGRAQTGGCALSAACARRGLAAGFRCAAAAAGPCGRGCRAVGGHPTLRLA